MIIYLTSSPSGGYRPSGKKITTGLDYDNDFVERLRMDWKPYCRFLIIAAFPESYESNDEMCSFFEEVFHCNGLTTSSFEICDYRDLSPLSHLHDYDIIMLSGGHVPTEMAFFEEIQLAEALKSFDGILIGVSAGTMNMAKTVYAIPEIEGESTDPSYKRFIPGLGLTDLFIIPHFDDVRDDYLDGKHLIYEIVYSDSYDKEIFALTDGSYITLRDGQYTLYGEAYVISNGTITQICENGRSLVL